MRSKPARKLSQHELEERQSWIDHDNEMMELEEFYADKENWLVKQEQDAPVVTDPSEMRLKPAHGN